jgi:uncharacterized membrane protein YqjE
MEVSEAPASLSQGEEARQRSLADDLRELAENARQLADAEIAYQKSRAAYAGGGLVRVAAFGALTAVLVFFALMVLAIGLVLALTPSLGAWGAMAVVFAGLVLLALLSAYFALSRWRRISSALGSGEKAA